MMPTLTAATRQFSRSDHPIEGIHYRDRRSCYRGGARASVRDQYIAIELDGELAELEIVEHRSDTAPDEPLYLLGATPELRPLAGRSGACRAGQHRVLRGQPSFSASTLPPGHSLFHRGSAQHARRAEYDEARSFGIWSDPALERDRPQLRWRAVFASVLTLLHLASL